MSYEIRPASREELNLAIEWAANEGWNPGLYDRDAFYATDPEGFYLGFLDGEPISSISVVAYDESFGFLGFYIVKPEHRGEGYGIRIWNEALKHLPTQNVGLDGVVDQQENYEKSGFRIAYRNIRYEGTGKARSSENQNIVPLSKVSFERVIKYDDEVFPVSRPAFLRTWFKQPTSLAVGYIDRDKLIGYGMVRKCKKGYKVGPLFAANNEVAMELFASMRHFVGEGTPVFLDTPEVNKEAVELAERHMMKPMFETARMYNKEEPGVPLRKVFGVTTFELG